MEYGHSATIFLAGISLYHALNLACQKRLDKRYFVLQDDGMAGKQSYDVTKALRWLDGGSKLRTVKAAAKRFKVHETTLWRALGKQKLQGENK